MNNRGEISPWTVVGPIVTLITVAVVGLVGLRILSPFAERCDQAGVFYEACTEISISAGSSISNLVGPLGVVVLLIALLIFMGSQA